MAETKIEYKGLNNTPRLGSADDMNNILAAGVYHQDGSYGLPENAPTSAHNAAVIVLKGRSISATGLAYDCFQIWISNNARTIYFRAKFGTWSPWQILFTWSES